MSALHLNGQLLTATTAELRELIRLVDTLEDDPRGTVIDWLYQWAIGRKHYITDGPYAPLSTEGAASAARVIRYLHAHINDER